jgi:AcrR family transcriptional regulator
MDDSGARRGKKLDPDPRVRIQLLSAASKIVRERGVRSLSVAQVLDRAQLSTRAFYRHFDSKDQLVSAVFLEMARVERLRLRRRMVAAASPVEAVVAWIDGRLDLAFNEEIRSDLRQMSLEAQSQMFAAPELVHAAYAEILKPLVEQLENGKRLGVFPDIDPETDAQSIQGAVWAAVERQWAQRNCDRAYIRARAQLFCLRGLGVTSEALSEILGTHVLTARHN